MMNDYQDLLHLAENESRATGIAMEPRNVSAALRCLKGRGCQTEKCPG